MTGLKFERLKVLSFDCIKNTRARWICLCDCGNKKSYDGGHLREGGTKSCGCLNRENSSKILKKYVTSRRHKGKNNPAFTHGESNTKFFKRYRGIVARCNTKSAGNYLRYGARGIKCEWQDYLSFKKDMHKSYLAHVKKFGYKNTTIDRVDPTKNYNKENCRWATWQEQAINRRPRNSVV